MSVGPGASSSLGVPMRARTSGRRALAALAFPCFVGTVFVSNLLVTHAGTVPVGFGLTAPAAVYVAGLAFGLRDVLHALAGRVAALVAVVLGAALSCVLAAADPRVAVASGAAFLVSEILDMWVYAPLKSRRPYLAVLASNTVGALVDSALFLGIAFGSLALFWGQVVGKGWVTLACLAVLFIVRRYRRGR